MALQHALLLDFPDRIEHFLGSAHCKRGYHQIAASVQRLLEHLGKVTDGVCAAFVEPVTVGGLDHQVVRFLHKLGIIEDWLVQIAHITAEYDLFGLSCFCQPQFNAGRTQ